MNDTIRNFGYPQTLVAELEHWVVLLRPAQPTLGSLILAAKSDAEAFGELPAAAHAELAEASAAIERSLGQFVSYTKINYLMLMIVDPHVHFHVIPRYEGVRDWGGREFVDVGWPKLPDLTCSIVLKKSQIEALRSDLIAAWQSHG